MYHGLLASRAKEMKPLPFEDFIPHWDASLNAEPEEMTEEQRTEKRAQMLAAFKAAAGGGVDLRPKGRGSQLRPKER